MQLDRKQTQERTCVATGGGGGGVPDLNRQCSKDHRASYRLRSRQIHTHSTSLRLQCLMRFQRDVLKWQQVASSKISASSVLP